MTGRGQSTLDYSPWEQDVSCQHFGQLLQSKVSVLDFERLGVLLFDYVKQGRWDLTEETHPEQSQLGRNSWYDHLDWIFRLIPEMFFENIVQKLENANTEFWRKIPILT